LSPDFLEVEKKNQLTCIQILDIPHSLEWAKSAQKLFTKVIKHQKEGVGVNLTLDFLEASTLLYPAKAKLKFTKIAAVDPLKNPANTQVTAFGKLEQAEVDKSGTTLDWEEVLSVANIMHIPDPQNDMQAATKIWMKKMLLDQSLNEGAKPLEVSMNKLLVKKSEITSRRNQVYFQAIR
jgi:hypothetical protein